MFTTKKLYEEDDKILTCSAHVLDVLRENDITSVVLDQTVFRPLTPKNTQTVGVIESNDKVFFVTGVQEQENSLRHIGTFESEPFELDEQVTCVLNEEYTKETALNQ